MQVLYRFNLNNLRVLLPEVSIQKDASKEFDSWLPRKLKNFLDKTGSTLEEKLFIVKALFFSFIVTIFSFILFKNYLLLLMPLIVLFCSYIYLAKKINKRLLNFESDYPALLLSISSSVKTGLDPIEAVCSAEKLFDKNSVIREELKNFRETINSGYSLKECISSFARNIDIPDLKLFRSAILISSEEGSSLSICLQRLAKVTRQRQSFRRKIKSGLALQKISSLGILSSSIIILISQFFINSEASLKAFHHPLGIKLLSLGGVLMTVGALWMIKICNSKV